MDLTTYFFIAIAMAFATWLIGKIWGYGTKKAITTILGLFVLMPIFIIYVIGVIKMQLNPEAINQIAASTIEALITYVAEKMPYIAISDFAGLIVGRIISAFTESRN